MPLPSTHILVLLETQVYLSPANSAATTPLRVVLEDVSFLRVGFTTMGS
jgi:hypothetical protein